MLVSGLAIGRAENAISSGDQDIQSKARDLQ